MNELPIREALPTLLAALDTHASVVLQAPPGAGKSTGVPLALLNAAWLRGRKIVMLEPRRLAARAVASYMAKQLNEAVGKSIGYRTRLDSKVGRDTRVEVVTEGILTRRLQSDPALEDTALVIFDEFHERSLQADLGLALVLDAQEQLRPDLKILVMSATMDGDAVSRLLGNAPVVTSAGRAYPVDVVFRTRDVRSAQIDPLRSVASVVSRALEEHEGDALVFLPGQGEIRRVQRFLDESGLRQTTVLPLFGELSAEEQDAAIRPLPGRRKVVLTTNIAETSLTIEGVRIVIDSGLVRRSRFDPASGMSRLETLRISRASAEQRRGRAGRLSSGVCYRLWTESEHAALAAQTAPEILEADLAPLALELASWGAADASALRWLDSPPAATLAQARELLRALNALDQSGKITAHGRSMAGIGAHPRLAHMLLCAKAIGLESMAADLAAILGERDLVRYRGQQSRDVDLRLRLEALRGERIDVDIEVDRGARQRAQRSAEVFLKQIGRGRDTSSSGDPGLLLAWAFPDRIAQSRGAGGRYLLTNGRGASLVDPQLLGNSEFLVIAELDDSDRDARIRLAAPIAREDLEQHFADQIVMATRIEWDASEEAVVAREERRLFAIVLERHKIDAPADSVRAALLEGLRELGVTALPWTDAARELQSRIEFVRQVDDRAPDPWPAVNDASLLATLDHWLGPWLDGVTRRSHLARLNLCEALQALLTWNQQTRLDELAPTHLQVPSGSRIPIDYSAKPPTLAVRLQEVFGLVETPRVGGGKVPLLMQLLSPARRPVQTTQDLASFWARGYHDVKKDLKGRYPKHYWPDDPLQAEATARAKPRK